MKRIQIIILLAGMLFAAPAFSQVNVKENSEGNVEGIRENDPEPKPQPQVRIQSNTKYDFVPGDKVLFFEDFSQDEIGDFPALWTTSGSGEIRTLDIFTGKMALYELKGPGLLFNERSRIARKLHL